MLSFRAKPLEKYSSLHFISILNLLGIKSKSASPGFSVVVNFNVQTPVRPTPEALMTFHLRDANTPSKVASVDFCITNLTRWRLDISPYTTFTAYLQKLNRKHYSRYAEAKEIFAKYGAKTAFIEGDWSEHVEAIYPLYVNVAKKHGTQLFDLDHFHAIAKLDQYKILCAWYHDTLIGALIIIEEGSVFHSICCGLDYNHSTRAHAYSWMHYEFIRWAIEAKKYTIADIGPTANETKACLDFQPVSSCMDVWAHNRFIGALLRFISFFISATIDSQAKLRLHFHL